MTSDRPRGLFGRVRALLEGVFSNWVRDREVASPHAVYENAIIERTRQYADLKRAVAGILYMRNKIEGEIRERGAELSKLQQDIARAVKHGDDDVALALITQKDALQQELQRAEHELDEISSECEVAKGNLVQFRDEIRKLEREKVRVLAALANARARKRIQEAFDNLSLDGEMKALESVREQLLRLKAENRIDNEIGDDGLELRIREIREEAKTDAARLELEELKRRLRPGSLPSAGREITIETVEPAQAAFSGA
ncbi:MAG: hypothetical protein GY725_21695 [bacterium]|nr:hypothetical protein [bacterium]